jgi:hypothetical protein
LTHSRVDPSTSSSSKACATLGTSEATAGDDVDPDDLFDAIDVLEFVLTGIYDTKTINAKAQKLASKKSGA